MSYFDPNSRKFVNSDLTVNPLSVGQFGNNPVPDYRSSDGFNSEATGWLLNSSQLQSKLISTKPGWERVTDPMILQWVSDPSKVINDPVFGTIAAPGAFDRQPKNDAGFFSELVDGLKPIATMAAFAAGVGSIQSLAFGESAALANTGDLGQVIGDYSTINAAGDITGAVYFVDPVISSLGGIKSTIDKVKPVMSLLPSAGVISPPQTVPIKQGTKVMETVKTPPVEFGDIKSQVAQQALPPSNSGSMTPAEIKTSAPSNNTGVFTLGAIIAMTYLFLGGK